MRSVKLVSAVGAAMAALGLSSANATPLLRIDINSDNIAENGSPSNSWERTEGDAATPNTVPPYPNDPDNDPGTGPGRGTDPSVNANNIFDPWFLNGEGDINIVGPYSPLLTNSATHINNAATINGFNGGPHYADMRVTLTASSTTVNNVTTPEAIDTIRRFGMLGTDSAAGTYNFKALYGDFAFVTRTSDAALQHMDIRIENGSTQTLQPNTPYNVTLYTYDKFYDAGGNNTFDPNIGNSTMHFTDLTTNGLGSVADGYIFNRLAGYANSDPAQQMRSR